MTRYLGGDDPEPSELVPAGLLLVPVRPGPGGEVLRLFRTPLGERTAVGFTDRRRLAAVLGPEQGAVELAEEALLAMADALGVTRLTVDPALAAAPAAALRGPDGWHAWHAHAANGGARGRAGSGTDGIDRAADHSPDSPADHAPDRVAAGTGHGSGH